MRVCIVGASGKLGQYMVQHALDRGYEVVGVCREQSAAKLDGFTGRITVIPGATDDREVIRAAVAGCDGVLTVLVPRGVHGYSTGTAQAVLDLAAPGSRLVFPLRLAYLDGLITNGKFCCVRRVQLSLTWWRRPLRLRRSALHTDVALVGEPDDPDLD